ncbi:hypothetical protein [Wohlfahrtiimonas larvae]|uniref:Uncharacterized protein n=1 Tax=Wohlfahrtiimonas larvae TaxID=1157986 RepID=A0ABP9MXM9_9GAMM|nr:hypothetical protein [Wohlfahrtiimonas larvae]
MSTVTSLPKHYPFHQLWTDIVRIVTFDIPTESESYTFDQIIPIADNNGNLYYLGEKNHHYIRIKLTQTDRDNSPSLLKLFNQSEILSDQKKLKFFTKRLEKANNLRTPTKINAFITRYPERYLSDAEIKLYQSTQSDPKFKEGTLNTSFLILSPSLYPTAPNALFTFTFLIILCSILMIWLMIQTIFYRTFIQLRINKMNVSGSVSEIEENFNLHPLNMVELSIGYMNQDWLIMRSFANLQILKLSDLLMFSPQQKQFYSKALETPLKIRTLTYDDIQKITSHLSRFYPEIYIGDDENILISYQHGRYTLTKLIETRKNSTSFDESLAFSDKIADQQSIAAEKKKLKNDNFYSYLNIVYLVLCLIVCFINIWIGLLMLLPLIIYDFLKGGLLLLRAPYDMTKYVTKTYRDYKKK